MSRMEIAECYMAFGGIPYYWRYLDKRFSMAQNLDRMFFCDGAPLADEFMELYSSLFRRAQLHRQIVRELAGHLSGMTRNDIAHALGISASGKLTDALEALIVSGFVRQYNPFGSGRNNQVFQLVDALDAFCAVPRLLKRRHQHGRQYRDDCNYDEQLDQCEPGAPRLGNFPSVR